VHKRFDEAVQFASSTKMYRQKVNNTQNNFSTKVRCSVGGAGLIVEFMLQAIIREDRQREWYQCGQNEVNGTTTQMKGDQYVICPLKSNIKLKNKIISQT
jgi:5-formaminoimidazole-4-carboxamide-1-beta-D-ribofuranosyl 5'-monophosphate synthetase